MEDIKNKGAYDALSKWLDNQSEHDVSKYPEDTREFVLVVCELWGLRPPLSKSQRAYWIQGARELWDACGEFGVALLRDVRGDYDAMLNRNQHVTGQATADWIVSSPMSLVKVARAKAGEKRVKRPDPNIGGKYAEWIEH